MKRVVRAFLISACATAAAGVAMSYLRKVDGTGRQADSTANRRYSGRRDPDSFSQLAEEQEAAMLKELEAYV